MSGSDGGGNGDMERARATMAEGFNRMVGMLMLAHGWSYETIMGFSTQQFIAYVKSGPAVMEAQQRLRTQADEQPGAAPQPDVQPDAEGGTPPADAQ